MRLYIDIIEGTNDADHHDAFQKSGFWGKSAAGAIFFARSTKRFLIAHRSQHVLEPSTWGTFGGAMDEGETPEDAARREVAEEAGVHGFDLTPMFVFKSATFRYYNFLAIVDEEFTPVLDWETQGFVWCDFGEWPKPLHFGMKSLLGDPPSVKIMKELSEA